MEEKIILWNHEKFLEMHYSKTGSETKKDLEKHIVKVWKECDKFNELHGHNSPKHVPYRLAEFHNYIRELNSDSD